MIKIRSINRILLAALTACSLWSCDGDFLSKLGVDNPMDMFQVPSEASQLLPESTTRDNLSVNRVEFSKDCKNFSVWTGVVGEIGPYALTDSTSVRIEVEEFLDGIKTSSRVTPRLVRALNTESDHAKERGVKLLVLVDLSLPQEQIDAQKRAVQEMRTVFDQHNLYVAFMSNSDVTPSREATDYIMNAYFQKWSSRKCLYRSILTKLQEMNSGQAPWDDAKELKLVVLSDGTVYDEDDTPMDPEHFAMENELLHFSGNAAKVYYVNVGKTPADSDSYDASESTNVLSSLCSYTGGAYLPVFKWVLLEDNMMGPDFRAVESNRFDFENPDGKVYRGGDHVLKIRFYNIADDKLVASATAKDHKGSLYKPLIVNGAPVKVVILEGVSAGLLLMLLTYLIFQFVVPYIRYRLFLRKYVVKYTGKNMIVRGHPVGDSCYLCKAPFQKDEEIVVKCNHTMHKSCWDENEYHCPEFGRHCQEGSHFYDREHLLDKRNASFYMKWILAAIAASILAWIFFTLWTGSSAHSVLEFMSSSQSDDLAQQYGIHMNQLPSYGFMIGFFLTLGITVLAKRPRTTVNYLDCLLRALVAGAGTSALYLLLSAACIALRVHSDGMLINLVPWILSSFLIAYISTMGTRIRLKKTIVLVAIAISLVSLNIWSSLYMLIGVDFRVLLLYSYILYAVGLALAIAAEAPHSDHYFLKVHGAVKTMDVALYKWFRSNPRAIVTIGKSVDCSLQLSWDLQGHVAPVHAEITLEKGILRLKALEDGVVFRGKELPVDTKVKLFHGNSFQIGQTVFTYLEKDI